MKSSGMKSLGWSLLVGLQLALVSTAAAASGDAPPMVRISWDLSLDAQGHVVALTTRDTRLASAHAELERQIRSWKFSSGKIDGVPVPTRTHLHLSFEARAGSESKYTLHMLSATTGPDYLRQDAPSYPAEAAHLRRQGLVQLSVRFDENGVVQDVQAYGDQETDALLARAARKAVRSWTFSPEVVGGRPRASTAIVPICFAIAGLTPPDCRIIDPNTHRSVDGLVAIDPAARLESNVIEQAP